MRSTFFMLAWVGTAFADTCKDADSQSLLQARKVVRTHKQTTAANDLLTSIREVANTFTADSTVTMTPAEVNAALGTASTTLQTMLPMFAQQHDMAQRELNDAVAAVQVCHDQNGDDRVRLEQAVATQRAVKHECQATLDHLVETENEACARAEDCLCDEARVETNGQRTQCATITEEYEAVFCESQHLCNTFQQCHSWQADIYSDLRADIEAEMLVRQNEYRTYVQVDCIMNLITAAMLSGTPIPDASLVACSNTNVDQLTLDFPEPPSAPTACPAPQHGDPRCDGALPVVFNPHLDAAPLTADSLTTSTHTGWNRPANVIQYGEVGLVGHYWHALEVDFQFSEPMAFTGVETDYSQNPYSVFTSMDGSTWTEVASGVSGSQTFSDHSVGLYARLRWEDTHGVNGIHARFLGVAMSEAPTVVEPPTCPGSGLLERDRCWYLSEVGGTCRQACTAQGLDFSWLVGGESSPLVPMLLGRNPNRRQFPWGRLECYVPRDDRYHTAHNTAHGNTRDSGAVEDWSYSVCQMACPCAPR